MALRLDFTQLTAVALLLLLLSTMVCATPRLLYLLLLPCVVYCACVRACVIPVPPIDELMGKRFAEMEFGPAGRLVPGHFSTPNL